MSQQPVEVYPAPNFPTQSSSSSHSNGSFGPVFIVLAVILALLIISTVLGRICNRRSKAEKSHHGHGSNKRAKTSKQNGNKFHHHHQGGGGGGEQGDIEFGFDKRFASSKVGANEDHQFKAPKIVPQGREPKGPVRFADDHIEFRTGA